MPHEPKPLPTGNKFKDKRALKNYNKEHRKQSDYNKKNVGTAREIAHEGTYTSGGRHVLGMKPVEGGAFTAEAPTTEQIPFQGPYSIAQQEINNLAWVMENKNISDQELNMLEEARLMLENRLELGIDTDLTYNNQIDRQNMNAQDFFEKPKEPVEVINKAAKLSNKNELDDPVLSKQDLDNKEVIDKPEPQPNMMSIADLKKWELDTRDTTPAGKAFGESGAEQRMAIRRRHLENRGTIFDDNVRD
tara:strand:- start:1637 stop:2377 length:741 start_codon:yes stop_codon:yes gene_type:complete